MEMEMERESNINISISPSVTEFHILGPVTHDILASLSRGVWIASGFLSPYRTVQYAMTSLERRDWPE